MAPDGAVATRDGSSSKSRRLLIIDDNPIDRAVLETELAKRGYEVTACDSVEVASQELRERRFDIVVIDVYLKHTNAIAVLKGLISLAPESRFIAVSSAESTRLAVEVLRAGAHDFLTKGSPNALLAQRIIESAQQGVEGSAPTLRSVGLFGSSAFAQAAEFFVSRWAKENDALCLYGEPGTGKTELASAIHSLSHRGRERLYVLNCADEKQDVRKQLFEGSATEQGLWARARLGTLVLDRVEALPAHKRAAIFKKIEEANAEEQEKGLEGAPRLIVLCDEACFDADFRSSFSEQALRMAPLRDRTEDIPALAASFVRRIERQLGADLQPLSAETLESKRGFLWERNLYDLFDFVESQALENSSPATFSAASQVLLPFREAKRRFERRYLKNLLERSRGNISEASRLARTHRVQIYRFLAKHSLGGEGMPHEPL